MKWYFEVLGGHTHVRVFMHGAKCGDLCFRNEEFAEILMRSQGQADPVINAFLREGGLPEEELPFVCINCGATSYHPEDRRHGYCARCKTFPEGRPPAAFRT